ncbi:hypothetical protein VM1G_08154 [Cytospora mali]|uniref:Uncharacterized protein n=1 Tax=Cytospora mali TaxID=578113 RepID=A0A194WAA6_CYTMA|nr:hypothetical protein VM1G_08154 [Valsa mali]
MVSSIEKHRSAAAFAPSPPPPRFSAFDYEQDANTHHVQRVDEHDILVLEGEGPRQLHQQFQKRQTKSDSSPLATSAFARAQSPSPTILSIDSSFSLGYKQDEEVPRGRTADKPVPGLQRDHDVNEAFFLIRADYHGASSLERLAKQYYKDSNRQIKAVLATDSKYASPVRKQKHRRSNADSTVDSRAVFSFYRISDRVHQETVIRDTHGNSVASSPLQLFIADFIPDQVLKQLNPVLRQRVEEASFYLPSQLLYKYLEQAEAQ